MGTLYIYFSYTMSRERHGCICIFRLYHLESVQYVDEETNRKQYQAFTIIVTKFMRTLPDLTNLMCFIKVNHLQSFRKLSW